MPYYPHTIHFFRSLTSFSRWCALFPELDKICRKTVQLHPPPSRPDLLSPSPPLVPGRLVRWPRAWAGWPRPPQATPRLLADRLPDHLLQHSAVEEVPWGLQRGAGSRRRPTAWREPPSGSLGQLKPGLGRHCRPSDTRTPSPRTRFSPRTLMHFLRTRRCRHRRGTVRRKGGGLLPSHSAGCTASRPWRTRWPRCRLRAGKAAPARRHRVERAPASVKF